ncbi:MAG: hypothetical protein QGG53_21970 [Planctomycetota bacterium]|nr:hypothetical protein [Planctomycetota bacterium]
MRFRQYRQYRQPRPVFAVAEPGWICESKALGPIHAKDIKRFALAEKLIEGTFDVWERRIDEWGEHGFVDYFAGPHLQYSGKFAKPYRYSAYTYTLRGDLWLIYARSGDRRIREFAESTNRAYMDNIFAHWNGNGKVRGLYVVSSDTDRQTGDGKGCLPFYWEGNPVMEISSSSNLDNFILLYYLTGYRRGKDHVLQYAEGVKRFWTKAKAKRSWRGLMLMRLLTQAYSFTWDPELRALAEATTDTFVDSEGEVGLTKERPYRSSTYKTQVDIAALLDARNVYGSDRYSDLSTKIAGFWWHNLLGKWPIFYTNPQGRIGHFLYRRAGDPSYAQGLLVQMRQAATAYYPDTGKVTGSASGNIGAEDSTFVFQGIPYTQDVVVKTGADKTPASSWACYEDFGYPSSIVLHKGDDGSLEIDVKTETGGKGAAGGVRLRAIEPATTSGMNLCRVSSTSSGAVTVRVPKDAPEGDYEIVPSTPGSHFALAHARVPLVVHAPDYFRPMPPQAPPVRWYFQVPENSRNGRILLESAASLFSPDGRPWADGKPVSGWIDLPSDKPGLWSFEATGYRLVAVRNLPPFFAAEDPKSYFIPKIPWQRTAAAELSTGKAPTDVRYVPGAVNVDGDQALSMTGRRRFSLNAGPDHPSGDGGQFVPFQQGTIEFFFRPNWSVFDLPEKHTKWLVRIQSTGNTWTLSYMKDLKARQWLLSHVLYGWFYSDGPMRRVTMRAYRRTVIERGRWSHIAWVWGRQEQASFTGTSRSKVLTARLFVNGRAGMQYSYRWEGQLPADRPKQFSLSGKIDAAYDELRLSDVQRYTADFIPPSRDGELRLDEHTRALFHFNGDTKGESHGHAGPMPVSLSP